MSNGLLEGKVAIVTGGGGAIGGAIVRRFAREGASVCIADFNLEAAEALVTDIEVAGGRAVACPLDVSDPAQCERAVQFTVERFGNPAVLANVAAAPTRDGSVVDLAFEDWQRELSVNLSGVFLMSKYTIPRMAEGGGGSIINIASTFGHIGVPRRVTYCTSKAGIINLTRVMAIDHGPDNIRVNSISPGAIDTPRSLGRYKSHAHALKVRGAQYLLGRCGSVDEIANGAVFLASDEGAFCTGSDFVIDGGYLAVKYPPGQSPVDLDG